MNYLAHIYLSGEDNELKIGNFIADSVKGKDFLKYPGRIQQGIILHRAIDTYTDVHPVFGKSRKRLFPKYRHYSGVIVDMFYDHFLAANWNKYSKEPLEEYTNNFYALLEENWEFLPRQVQDFFPYMLRDDWFLCYATLEGVEKILAQMNGRTSFISQLHLAVKELEIYYKDFENEFLEFFPDLIDFTSKEIEQLKD
ncbi:MAG: acyl carrier protein phosphodiesterase [Salegentibacter sp.]|uniref:Acyl carrier protein phosphodiesterase n=1 Tax=Salegentibacter flavus TaxID=287099 RepID=A0A1I5A886_9FLAO|nr:MULTISPECIES: acyl carrier protein phosphodiesterase [Salegentibacter]MDR9457488.1 acyl carrier protein phosphodiesterase [Salegentibacter sp.]SFN58687.1 Acyl carrier protein phosphodiesterase [Salegentibacter flavus]